MEDQRDEKKEAKLKLLKKKYSRFTQPKKNLLIHLENTMGNISMSCNNADISRKSFYNYLKDDEVFKDAYEDIRDQVVDFYETKLVQAANNGEISAIIFGLKCQGKHRGWAEKSQIDLNATVGFTFTLNMNQPDKENEPIG